MDTLTFSTEMWGDLHKYLDHPVERMAFLAAVPDDDKLAGKWTVVDAMFLDDNTDYELQGWAGMELADDIRPRSLKWATALRAALVEVHSHGLGRWPTTFSNIDLRGLVDGVPRLVWRLGGRPYGAIVLGGSTDHDSLAWAARDAAPMPISRIVVGTSVLTPTGLALDRIANLETAK